MAEVALSGVEKRFGDVEVVKGVSVSVNSGEFLVLVGPSGCGKSTCLRMIAGLETVSAGEVRIAGRVVNDVPPKDRNIGMVFQSYALYPHMSVKKNLGFGLKLQNAAPSLIEERIESVATSLGLEDLLHRKPKELSGGQRQRVAIGRALVKEPDVFLFDEPLSNLDAALRVKMRTELAELHQKLGTTMIYVTHDQVEAMMLADRIAVLNGGVLQQVGPPLELYSQPKNRFVAGFIGSPSMNFVPGALVGSGSDTRLSVFGAELPLRDFSGESKTAQVEVGIRPQDVIFGSGNIRGQVALVEMLGWEAFVHVELALEQGVHPADSESRTIVARVEGRRGNELEIGESVALTIPPEHAHVFDGNGDSIWCGNAIFEDAAD